MYDMNVVVTGAGSPGIAGTVFALRNNEDKLKINIIGVDCDNDASGKYLCNSFYKIPRAKDKSYIDEMLNVCSISGADVILPQVTDELEPLSKSIDAFSKRGINIASSAGAPIANDKLLVTKAADELGFVTIKYYERYNRDDILNVVRELVDRNGSCFVKALDSSGGRGIMRVYNDAYGDIDIMEKPKSIREVSLSLFTCYLLNDYIGYHVLIEENLPGPEFSVDCFRMDDIFVAIPRIRHKIRTGIAVDTEILPESEDKSRMVEMSKALAEKFDLRYCFGFQFMKDKDGFPVVIECNPRVQGTMSITAMAGANIIYWSVVAAHTGKSPISAEEANIIQKMVIPVRMKRVWGGIGEFAGCPVGSI